MKALAALFLFLSLTGLAPASQTLRVVTWNLQWFPGGKVGADQEAKARHVETVRAAIRKMDPDILLLQEVGSQAVLEETLKPLGDEWRVAIVSRFGQGGFTAGQQLAIAAKFPAEAAWAEAWERGWAASPRGYAYASFRVNGKRVACYCLHLKSNLGDPEKNTSKREDAVEQLLAHLDAKEDRKLPADAVIIGGDFNTDDPDSPGAASPAERSFPLLRKQGFWWTFAGLEHPDRITCPRKGKYPDASFDHIWTKGLGKSVASVVKAEGSDHLPVVVEVVIP